MSYMVLINNCYKYSTFCVFLKNYCMYVARKMSMNEGVLKVFMIVVLLRFLATATLLFILLKQLCNMNLIVTYIRCDKYTYICISHFYWYFYWFYITDGSNKFEADTNFYIILMNTRSFLEICNEPIMEISM